MAVRERRAAVLLTLLLVIALLPFVTAAGQTRKDITDGHEQGSLKNADSGSGEFTRADVSGKAPGDPGAGPGPMSVSDLNVQCGRTYRNMPGYLNDMAGAIDKMAGHYKALSGNLALIEAGFAKQCQGCQAALQKVKALGLDGCDPALAGLTAAKVAADTGFGPTVCDRAVKQTCERKDLKTCKGDEKKDEGGDQNEGKGELPSCEGGDLSKLPQTSLGRCAPYLGLVKEHLAKHGLAGRVDPLQATALMMQESTCNPSANCGGIMQVDYPCRVQKGHPLYCKCKGNARIGIDLGMKELRHQLDKAQKLGASPSEALALVEFGFNRGGSAMTRAISNRKRGMGLYDAMMASCVHYYGPGTRWNNANYYCRKKGMGPRYPELIAERLERACREMGGKPNPMTAGKGSYPSDTGSSAATPPPPGEAEKNAAKCPLCAVVPCAYADACEVGGPSSSGEKCDASKGCGEVTKVERKDGVHTCKAGRGKDKSCSQPKATLVTAPSRTVITVPAMLAACQQALADVKDACTVDGSASLGGATLDPCSLQQRVSSDRGKLDGLTGNLGPVSSGLRGVAGDVGTAMRTGQPVAGAQSRIDALVNTASANAKDGAGLAAFQTDITKLVTLTKGPMARDVGGGIGGGGWGQRMQAAGGWLQKRLGMAPAHAATLDQAAEHVRKARGLMVATVGYRGDKEWSKYCGRFNLKDEGKDKQAGSSSGGKSPQQVKQTVQRIVKDAPKAGCGKPPGRCESELKGGAQLQVRETDTWAKGQRMALGNLARLDPNKLFLNMDQCFRYSTPRGVGDRRRQYRRGGRPSSSSSGSSGGGTKPDSSPGSSTAPRNRPAPRPMEFIRKMVPSWLKIPTLNILRVNPTAVRTFHAGDLVRVYAEVENTGDGTFELGRANARLRVIGECDCSACTGGGSCPCTCEEGFIELGAIRMPLLPPGESWDYLSDPFTLEHGLSGTTIQLEIDVLDTEGEGVAWADGVLSHIVEIGDAAVVHGSFVDAELGTPISEGNPGMEVAGRVRISNTKAPVTAEVYAVLGAGQELAGSRTVTVLNGTGEHIELMTEPVALTEDHLGWPLQIGVRLLDSDGQPVLDMVLPEKGFDHDSCTGPEMTAGCLYERERAVPEFPQGHIEVKEGRARVTKAAFLDSDGMAMDAAAVREPVTFEVTVENSASTMFAGTIEAWAQLADGREVTNSRVTQDVTGLEHNDVFALQGPVFGAFNDPPGGSTMGLHVIVRDRDGTTWLDEDMDSTAHPYSRLELEEGVWEGEGPRQPIDASFTVGDCYLEVSCDACLPTCTLTIEPESCTLVTDKCECTCTTRR